MKKLALILAITLLISIGCGTSQMRIQGPDFQVTEVLIEKGVVDATDEYKIAQRNLAQGKIYKRLGDDTNVDPLEALALLEGNTSYNKTVTITEKKGGDSRSSRANKQIAHNAQIMKQAWDKAQKRRRRR